MNISLFFYQKPKISKNPKHTINFVNKDDKYNPFSIYNIYDTCNIVDLLDDINKYIIDSFYENIISYDLGKKCSNLYSYKSSFALQSFINHAMQQHKISFYGDLRCFCHSIFIQICINDEFHSMKIFLQANGVSHNKKIVMTGVYVLFIEISELKSKTL